ncbi:MAG TPA: hypothetical protein VHZ24_19180 [Pirellulales bacterium]|jgi:hypothetical protein|nr:hypothetical protein [Pirellulales bacterium]
MRRILLALGVMCVVGLVARAQQTPGMAKPTPVPDRATLEKQFEEAMSGATLVGTFTVAGRDDGKPLKHEKYTISKVSKVRDDFWLFQARIQYGDHDATLPLTLEVKWAGDTPVITLTDLTVPGFGTFTCRVLIYRDQYCGTWSGGDHGGAMFGRIEHEQR